MSAPNEERWSSLKGGYKVPFDPRPLLAELESDPANKDLWRDLIENLYHQGDVGDASYATVPELISMILRDRPVTWHPWTLILAIELARGTNSNPELPDWLQAEYDLAFKNLETYSLRVFPVIRQPEVVRSMLALFAICKGLRVYARAIDENSEQEMKDIFSEYWGDA